MTQKEMFAVDRFGFEPDVVIAVAGVTMGDDDRQLWLQQASALLTPKRPLTTSNGGLELAHDSGNQFDEYAVRVSIATRVRDGALSEMRQVGFIPRRFCPKCDNSWGGAKADAPACPKCGALMLGPHGEPLEELTRINQVIATAIIGKDIVHGAVAWIGQGQNGKSWGCRIALRVVR